MSVFLPTEKWKGVIGRFGSMLAGSAGSATILILPPMKSYIGTGAKCKKTNFNKMRIPFALPMGEVAERQRGRRGCLPSQSPAVTALPKGEPRAFRRKPATHVSSPALFPHKSIIPRLATGDWPINRKRSAGNLLVQFSCHTVTKKCIIPCRKAGDWPINRKRSAGNLQRWRSR